MSQFNISWQRIPSLLSTIRVSDILDILVVAYLIYKLIMLIRRTNSFHLARGVLLILIALGLSGVMNLTMVNRLLRRTVELGLIALVILFQPELRRLLERVGSNIPGFFSPRRLDTLEAEGDITQTVMACEDMSATRRGADSQRHGPERRDHGGAAEEHLLRQGPAARRRGHHPRRKDCRRRVCSAAHGG